MGALYSIGEVLIDFIPYAITSYARTDFKA